jgi:pimeloyl-ACP methyl ester carboxylesterase
MTGHWQTWWEQFKTQPPTRRPPLVLINGLSEQSESWFRNIPFWRRYFDLHVPNLLVYDGPAVHQRIDNNEPISVDYLVEQLHRYLVSFVQTPPYHLVAASMGGKVAVEFAARYRDLVDRIVLLCPSGMGDVERLPVVEGVCRNDVKTLVDSVFHDPSRVDFRLFEYYGRQFNNRRWKVGLLKTVRGTMSHVVRDRLADVPHPTLLVSGREDRIVSAAHAAEAARSLQHGRYICLKNCGHAPQMEKPWLINRLVLHFLTSPTASVRPARRELLPVSA